MGFIKPGFFKLKKKMPVQKVTVIKPGSPASKKLVNVPFNTRVVASNQVITKTPTVQPPRTFEGQPGNVGNVPGALLVNPYLPLPGYIPITGIPPLPPADQYPGAMFGAAWPDVQALIRKQRKAQGFTFTALPLVRNTIPINLSGTAKILLGFTCGNSMQLIDPGTTFTLVVNNDVVVDKLCSHYVSPEITVNGRNEDYIEVLRPLDGSDDITLFVDSLDVANQLYDLVFYFL